MSTVPMLPVTPKADKTYVDTNIDNINSRVDGIDRGYGGTNATLEELKTAYPTGDTTSLGFFLC